MKNKSKLISLKTLICTLAFFTSIYLILIIHIYGSDELIYAIIMSCISAGMTWLVGYYIFSIHQNGLKSKYSQLEAQLKEIKPKMAQLIKSKENSQLAAQNAENWRQAAEKEVKELQDQKNNVLVYKKHLKKMYLSSQLEDTRVYASRCFEDPQSLDLFDPMKYARNPFYAQVIDANAKELLELFDAPDPTGLCIKAIGINRVRRRHDKLLKGAGGGGCNSSVPIKERTRLSQIKKKEDTNYER